MPNFYKQYGPGDGKSYDGPSWWETSPRPPPSPHQDHLDAIQAAIAAQMGLGAGIGQQGTQAAPRSPTPMEFCGRVCAEAQRRGVKMRLRQTGEVFILDLMHPKAATCRSFTGETKQRALFLACEALQEAWN